VATVLLPNNYDARVNTYRLRVFLHSYGSNATSTLARWFSDQDAARNSGQGTICILPSGLLDNLSNPYWNSNDSCCALDAASPQNDVAYLRALILLAMATYAVDSKQVEIWGYSNGAMMAHTMGLCCSDIVTSIWCFAGYAPAASDSHYCNPGLKVHVTLVWGDADTIVVYPGDPTGTILTDKPTGIYPGALATAELWRGLNGCTAPLSPYDTIDATDTLVGAETSRMRYAVQATNGSFELWTITGGGHVVGMNTTFLRQVELRSYACRRL
jgi:poly(3-hydroxybutyrate) depolymerase